LDANSILPSASARYSLGALTRYFLKLGAIGFGGPVALVGYMYRDLVESRGWISEDDYKEGLTLAQLMPGPLAAQLAMYLGFVHYRILGATVVGAAFVLPSFLMVVAIGWAYLRYGGLPWMQAAFYGVGATVIGIIAISAWKLTTKNIGRDRLLWVIFVVTSAFTVWTQSESVWLFLGSGVLAWLVRAPPKRRLGPGIAPAVLALDPTLTPASAIASSFDWNLLAQIGVFFAKAGAFVFGSGLAIVPFLYAGVVHQHAWLNERQFVDAVAVAMLTPGPVVITVGFIGYLIAGLSGAVVASVGTFLPCYLFTIVPAPYFKKYGKRPAIVAFVDGVTAAAIGAITGAVLVLASRTIVDMATAFMALATAAVIWRFKKVPEPAIVAIAAIVGVLAFPGTVHGQARAPLELAYSIPLADVHGRIDHLAIDIEDARLFVAALGNGSVEVVDLRARARSDRITGQHEPQGIGYLPNGKRLLVANAGGGVDVFEGWPLRRVSRIDRLDDADNVRIAPTTGNVYVGFGHALAVISADGQNLLGSIDLAGHPESFQLESPGSRVFVNVPTAREIVVVDREKRAVTGKWMVADASANFPMALDQANHRLFVATRHPASLLVYDTESGTRVASLPTGGDADDLFYDAKRRQIYVVCGEGVIDVVQQRDPNRYVSASKVQTVRGARTGLFAEDVLYVAVPVHGRSPAEIRAYAVQ
jgi:chromate transporter